MRTISIVAGNSNLFVDINLVQRSDPSPASQLGKFNEELKLTKFPHLFARLPVADTVTGSVDVVTPLRLCGANNEVVADLAAFEADDLIHTAVQDVAEMISLIR